MDNNDEIKSQFQHTKGSLTVRMLVSVYLVYTGVSLLRTYVGDTANEPLWLGIASIIFILLGGFWGIQAGIWYQKGAYVGGKLDEVYIQEVKLREELEKQEAENCEEAEEQAAEKEEQETEAEVQETPSDE